MKTYFLNSCDVYKKRLFVFIIRIAISFLPIYSQITYMPSDERIDADMGADRVARLFTAAY
jgi:hypothetical protein